MPPQSLNPSPLCATLIASRDGLAGIKNPPDTAVAGGSCFRGVLPFTDTCPR